MSAAHEFEPGDPPAVESANASKKNGNISHSAELRKNEDGDGDEDEDEQEEDEPRLKYHKLTSQLSSVYRNGDDTSTFLVAGDKIVVGTHNGNIHVLSLPTLQALRTYHAHSASVTALSISPIPPPPVPGAVASSTARSNADSDSVKNGPSKPHPPGTPQSPKRPPVPNSPSNQIHIASASVDGHVCVSSLIDMKDVTLRNFARPVQAVALSPEYKYDKTYLSGGLAGNLILTVGGKAGVSADANTSGAAAAAQGWLGSIGLGSNNGKDTILHSGEGSISTIKFSRTSKYVAWVNEHGIKIMRSHMKLESPDLHLAWKRIAHVDRPGGGKWDEMAAVWKGRIEWVNDRNVEPDEEPAGKSANGVGNTPSKGTLQKRKPEKLVAGWGDTAWVLHVHPGGPGVGKHVGERSAGSVDLVHKLTFDDCIISGLSLYTPSLLAVLAYRTRDDNDKPIATPQPGKSRRHRQNALSPELRLVEVATGEEVDVDTLTVSRFESLSATDYHLGTLYVPTPSLPATAQRGALESLGAGFWDVSNSATRLFSSAASVNSGHASGDHAQPSILSRSSSALTPRAGGVSKVVQEIPSGLRNPGLKLFIQTPYDCVLAIKRDLSDHLSWLLDHHKYGAAWDLLEEHPGILGTDTVHTLESTPRDSPRRPGSLIDFFADDSASQTTMSLSKGPNSAVAKEKRRIGDLWLQQLVSAKDWTQAGQVAGKVLGTSTRWEHWVLAFAQADHFDEITPYIPSTDMRPPLPSFVYEVVLGHYISHDPSRFSELLESWNPELFDITSVVNAIENRLEAGEVDKEGDTARDWRLLMYGLAKMKLASGQAREALHCYVQLQDAESAMALVRDYHLIDAVADDVVGLIMLRVTKDQLESPSIPELREASTEAITLLVSEAYNGIVQPQTVVSQLQASAPKYEPFLYFYFASLWHGPPRDEDRIINKVERLNLERQTNEGRMIVEQFADLTLSLFARYDGALLSLYLQTSTAYSLDKAVQICEERKLTTDLVYLFSKTGETRRALFLIIEELDDVSRAITFAKENPDLWEDLLDYGMDKPAFIRALLLEVGTGGGTNNAGGGGVNAVQLVRRIPDGLEVEGLKDAVQKLVREWDVQFSISEGVARVLRGEVAAGLEVLREGRRRAVKFEVKVETVLNAVDAEKKRAAQDDETVPTPDEHQPGHCVGCAELFEEDEPDFLVGFACGHVFHLDCLLDRIKASKEAHALIDALKEQTHPDTDDAGTAQLNLNAPMSVGSKISHAQVIRSAIGGGCPVCVRGEDKRDL